LRTVEGVKAYDEAIAFMQNMKPIKPLTWNANLASAAEFHTKDTGPKG